MTAARNPKVDDLVAEIAYALLDALDGMPDDEVLPLGEALIEAFRAWEFRPAGEVDTLRAQSVTAGELRPRLLNMLADMGR